jgi:hypothetical protein
MTETLPTSSFADLLQIEDVQFVQTFSQQRSMTGGGETRYADRAPSMWKADLNTLPMPHATAEGLMAVANSRAGGLKTLLLFNHRLSYPSTDPNGSIIGSTVPKLGTITDRLHVSFSGFPAGYQMPVGTFFGIRFDGDARYYLGQFVESRTADSSGDIASVEVWPPLPSSISGTPDVVIKKPCAKFRIVPGSAYPSRVDATKSTIRLSLEQTYSA